MKWYKQDPDAFMGGVTALTLEEIGAYTMILQAIYSQANEGRGNGSVRDDIAYLTRLWHCDPRVARRIRQRLLDLGKLKADGNVLTNGRATCEIRAAQVRLSLKQKVNENKEAWPPAGHPATALHARATTTTREKKEVGETEILEQVGRPNGRPFLPVEKAFEEFWEKYPRKVGKGAARKSFARIAKSKKVGFSEIMAALKCTKWPDDPQFIPHPATWLNQGRWEDEPTGDARPMPTPEEAAAAAEYLRARGFSGGIRTAFKGE